MIRAIHFSAIALLAAASLIAATSAGSQGQIEAIPTLSILDQRNAAPLVDTVHATGFGPGISDDDTLDGKMSFVTALIAERVAGVATPNG